MIFRIVDNLISIRIEHMSNDQEDPSKSGAISTADDQAKLQELLFRLARLLGRQAAEDQIRQHCAANDNRPQHGDKIDRA